MKFTRLIPVITFFAILTVNAAAQDYVDRVRENRNIASGLYMPYHHGDLTDTPAPKGYRPMYVSHYGRHGSRYHSSMSFFRSGIEGLKVAADSGILTDAGRRLYSEMQAIVDEHEGMVGELTPLGAREHREIASRMYHRFPDIFKSGKRTEACCVSSVVPRCLISMANFTTELKDLDPDINYSFYTGIKYYQYIAKDIEAEGYIESSRHLEDSLRNALCRYDDLFALIFTDRVAADRIIAKPQSFVKSVFNAGAICLDLDFMNIDIFKYFSDEELAGQWITRSDKMYAQFGNCIEWGEVCAASAKDLLNDFITKADEALKDGSDKVADLRFGHDTGIMPLYCLLGIKGMDVRYPMAEGHEHWTVSDFVPMGTNFQMIFYQDRKGNTIVKLLNNEEETCLPALQPWQGPYYRWEDLRAYLVSLIEK